MDLSIALPNTIPGAAGPLMAQWAARAEQRGFSGVAATERLVYPGHEPMLALAAAASVTRSVRLATNIVIGPLRSSAVLAKEAETLQSLSGGRFTLGLGPGVRDDDFAAAERDYGGRGAVLDQQLAELHAHWHGGASRGEHHLDPAPPLVPLLVAGLSPAAVRRVVTWGAGWTAPGLEPELIRPQLEKVREAWGSAGRAGAPHTVALLRFVLGDDAAAESAAFVREYFAVTGADAEKYVAETPRTAAHITELVDQLAGYGVSEVVFHPTAAATSQVDRLADVLLGPAGAPSDRRLVSVSP